MASHPHAADTPAPAAATAAGWFGRGVLNVFSLPALVLFSAQVGFAALAREAGFTVGETMAIALFVYALPAQVVFIGFLAAGQSLPAIALAVALSSVRFLPMVLAWAPVVRPERGGRIGMLFASWFVAVTSWVFAMSHLPNYPRAARLPFFVGFGMGLAVVSTAVVGISHVLLERLPPLVSGGLVMLTPIYFICALWGASRGDADRLALMLGLFAGPAAAALVPGVDLLAAGLVAGTAAYIIGRVLKARRAAGEAAQ
ncbi:AzlC family ABC transporter permease [Acuticoccus yangtzensis]|uniref:AzlC family ABC transporter permease n=1 Tax=Acuticoccus yangtzensis TaxID=1443441 RepID=UPI0009496407|nr:AzlC family ABC transporter permease [Acuticoccus yangtzensis]ORE94714.1 AzlC protein [Stappia sp. 22II-S9-Z10]